MPHLLRSLAAGTALTCFCWSATGVAAPGDTHSSEAAAETRREEARRQFQRGAELYRAEHYREAVAAFLEADRLAPSPALSFNIARAYERLNDVSGALRWYRDYLRRSPNAKNAAEVKTRIAVLAERLSQAGLQQLSVLSSPTGATVVIDGRAVGATPFTAELPPGRHRLLLNLPGYLDSARDFLLAARLPRDVVVSLEPEPHAAPNAPRAQLGPETGPAAREPSPQTRFGAVPWVVMGSGAATLGGAAVFEVARSRQETAARNAATQLEFKQHADAMQRDQTRARILAGVGSAVLVTGGVLLLVNRKEPEAPRVALGCTLHGCSASARGSF